MLARIEASLIVSDFRQAAIKMYPFEGSRNHFQFENM